MQYATEEYYINKIKELESKVAYYENPCIFCGIDSWSTHVCDNCVQEHSTIDDGKTNE